MKRKLFIFFIFSLLFIGDEHSLFAKDSGTLMVALEREPESLGIRHNYYGSANIILENIHDTLFHPNSDATVSPALAICWKIVDQNTYQITLRKGAFFHDGEPVTSKAVEFSLNYMLDPRTQYYYKEKLAIFETIEVVDSHKFRVRTRSPYAPALYTLSRYLPILPPKYLKNDENQRYVSQPVGCGPYKFVKWSRGRRIVLERFEKYYGPKPAYKNLIFKPVPEESTRAKMLKVGEVDVSMDLSYISKKNLEKSKKLYLSIQKVISIYLGLNTKIDALKDKRVRQAFNYSVDRDSISKKIFQGRAVINAGPIIYHSFGADPELEPYPFDTEKAQALLSESNFSQNASLRLTFVNTNNQIEALAYVVQSNFKKSGINVTLEPLPEYGIFLNLYKEQALQMYLSRYSYDPEPDFYMFNLFHSNDWNPYYENSEVDKLLENGRKTIERDKRFSIYKNIDNILYMDSPWVFLHTLPINYVGISKKIDISDWEIIMRGPNPCKGCRHSYECKYKGKPCLKDCCNTKNNS